MTEAPTLQAPGPIEAPPAAAQRYEDYWGTEEIKRYTLPDGVQYFEYKLMNEGAKSEFQKMTNKGITFNQRSSDAHLAMDPAGERHALIKKSLTGWNLFKDGAPILFSPQMLEKWLTAAPPHIVEKLEAEIRLANPWLTQDMTIEQIDEELDRLHKLRQTKVDEAAGESSSATK